MCATCIVMITAMCTFADQPATTSASSTQTQKAHCASNQMASQESAGRKGGALHSQHQQQKEAEGRSVAGECLDHDSIMREGV
jgi:hypothetical protein